MDRERERPDQPDRRESPDPPEPVPPEPVPPEPVPPEPEEEERVDREAEETFPASDPPANY
jgi:hypothetical protein